MAAITSDGTAESTKLTTLNTTITSGNALLTTMDSNLSAMHSGWSHLISNTTAAYENVFCTRTAATAATDGSLGATTIATPGTDKKCRLVAITIFGHSGTGAVLTVVSNDTTPITAITMNSLNTLNQNHILDVSTTAANKLWQIAAVAAAFGNAKDLVVYAWWQNAP